MQRALAIQVGAIGGALTAVAAGCYVQSAPPAAPPPPPSPYYYGAARPGAPPPAWAYPQLAQAEAAQRNTVRSAPPPPAPNVPAQINVGLAAMARTLAKGCLPFPVAPNRFVRLDCRRYTKITSAKVVNAARTLSLFHLGTGPLRLDPQSVGDATPPLFLTGLESLFQGLLPPPSAPAPPPTVAPGPAPAPAPAQTLPTAVDHRAQGIEGPIKDQQVVGACTAFSLSSVMDNAIRRLNGSDVVSAMHVWSRYADATMPSAESRNEGRPLAVWNDFPYDEREACRMEPEDDGCAELLAPPVQINTAAADPVIQGQIRTADARGRYTITEVDQIDPIDPNVIAVDVATGKDVWLAMGVSQDAWTAPQVQMSAVIPDWSIEDGGHAVAVAGYRMTSAGRQFLVHNSWGTSWGQGGYAWVSEAMVRQHGQYAYTIVVVDRLAPAPPPTPVPTSPPGGATSACQAGFTQVPGSPVCQKLCASSADCGGGGTCVRPASVSSPPVCVAVNPLTDDDCGEGQLVDIVTGQCAAACANNWRPAAGWCPFGR
ncbi:MAG: C1 family peptidase [Polyangiaceae bacterium]